jgi:hypothetical protein
MCVLNSVVWCFRLESYFLGIAVSHQLIKYQTDLNTSGGTILVGHTGKFTVVDMGSFI